MSSNLRRSLRRISPSKKYKDDYVCEEKPNHTKRKSMYVDESSNSSEEFDTNDMDIISMEKPESDIIDSDVAGKNMYGFNTPKKRTAMTQAALNTPKTPKITKTPKTPKLGKTPKTPKTPKQTKTPAKTPKTGDNKSTLKTPSRLRSRVKSQIEKFTLNDSNSDFSGEESDFIPSDSESNEDSEATNDSSSSGAGDDDEPKTPHKGRRPIIVPVIPKTPSVTLRMRRKVASKNSVDYIPESEYYFQSHSTGQVLTSDHTLDRLKNPRLPADRLFNLLAEIKTSTEHEKSIKSLMDEYRSYFYKWMCVLNEGFNILVYGLGSKRQLLQSFHREILAKQTVLVINGFFPSLTLKDILDSVTNEILDAGVSSANVHEAMDMIEEEFSLIPETHLYIILHNLDGLMLRNTKAQSILSRLASVANIHLIASIDHINTPLLWDHSKLSNFNFSWWDCTTMLPYSDETAFENSLLVQNSGELALSSMRSVFLSLTTNSRGIYMLIVKYQLKNIGNSNYQGISFKELYSSCRESFLVSSDLALRAQLTEFLDHKMVKSKRNMDGSEQLTIPIETRLLKQFSEEQETK